MSQSCHTLTRAVAACVCIFSFTTGLRAQGSVLQLPGPWPTGWAGCATCAIPSPDAFQILYGSGGVYCPIPDAALRLSIYGGCYSPIFGQLAVVDTLHYSLTFPRPAEWFSAFAPLDA